MKTKAMPPPEISAAAAALGRRGKDKPKNFTPSDIERRRAQMRANQAKRWAGHVKKAAVALLMLATAHAQTMLDKPAGRERIQGEVIAHCDAGIVVSTKAGKVIVWGLISPDVGKLFACYATRGNDLHALGYDKPMPTFYQK